LIPASDNLLTEETGRSIHAFMCMCTRIVA
jgi:hypothetical protein